MTALISLNLALIHPIFKTMNSQTIKAKALYILIERFFLLIMNPLLLDIKKIILCLAAILVLIKSTQGGRISLEEDIADGYLDDFTKIEAAFILSGVTDTDSLANYLDWYTQLLAQIRAFQLDVHDAVGSARTVFLYLHSAWLKTYALESTTLIDIVRNKEYNCVSATILYNILCEDLGWSCQAFETPTHVYTIFNNYRQNLIVENTSTMGFDILKNLQAYSQYLARYYSKNELLQIGLDKLYYHENSKGRLITNTELLGLLAYNRAYLARQNKDFEAAYDLVLLAQQFNRDSRSNVNFEIGLYYVWGKQLFENKNHIDAFAVFADGFYRYPDHKDLLNHTRSSFYRALQDTWQNKNWPESMRLIDEIHALKILEDRDLQNIRQVLLNWRYYFKVENNVTSASEVSKLLRELGL